MDMKRKYFGQGFIDFFTELELNNHKAWFDENRSRYEEFVKQPFYTFIDDLIDAVKAVEPGFDLERKNSVFRINRDIRFSKDKVPYKTHVAAVIGPGGRKHLDVPSMYVHIERAKTVIGGGSYKPDKKKLYSVRSFMAEYPDRVNTALNDASFSDHFGELLGEKNKVIPNEFKEAAHVVPQIYNKSFHFMKKFEGSDLLLSDQLIPTFIDLYRIAKPVNKMLAEAMQV